MEIQTLLKKLGQDIEEQNSLLNMAESEHRETSNIKLELEIAIENYSTVFSALSMLV